MRQFHNPRPHNIGERAAVHKHAAQLVHSAVACNVEAYVIIAAVRTPDRHWPPLQRRLNGPTPPCSQLIWGSSPEGAAAGENPAHIHRGRADPCKH